MRVSQAPCRRAEKVHPKLIDPDEANTVALADREEPELRATEIRAALESPCG